MVKTKSLLIPCKDEGKSFIKILELFNNNISKDTEIIVILDDKNDSTYNLLKNVENKFFKIEFNLYSGPVGAIKTGIENSISEFVCIAMGDGSDDPKKIDELFFLLERGCDVAVASRYSKGGQFIGKKSLKYILSKYSGILFYYFFNIPTKDPNNMFKAYSRNFLNEVSIESTVGFTLGLELIVKGKLMNKKIGEIPTIWIDRDFGESKFDFKKFLPHYLYWVYRLILRRR